MTEKKRVIISDSLAKEAADILSSCPHIDVDVRAGISASELTQCLGQYHGLLVRSRTKVTADMLSAADKLQIVGRAGIGVDNIDLSAAKERNVIVENAPNGNAVTTAEHAICLLLSLVRHIPQATASMKAGRWEKKKLKGTELTGKTFGIVGLGNIGKIVADRAQGLRMNVIAADPFVDASVAETLGVRVMPLDDMLAAADFISCHAPLTPKTRGMIGVNQFAAMKDGVFFVHAARGGIVDEPALVAALDSGKVAGAALDVFETEPPGEGHPLVTHPKVICSPHLGASTAEAQTKVAIEIAEQMVQFFTDGKIIHCVNGVGLPNES